ncbi:hypothetical protein [Streptomyces sp. NPDC057257]|uniref:hypothetical protein n=1 Tax=Streptomyces sp. NPDC057257 TaxID=3346071 RepID=UPI003642E5C7
MSSPAGELRAAATKLRALATAASDDSGSTNWHASRHFPELPDSTFTALWATGVRSLIGGGGGRGRPPGYVSAPVGDYIAALDPAVGLLFADWLDAAAVDAEQIGPAPHALAVARAINGGQS